ncbi:hypothetical protein CWI37_0327p0010 [Hamiltosporidium tvaerminnensis]|uniref:Leucine-rich repeat-containing protein n=1 Tax=Hamiltosporidium tvaerminnensis TaxID=1176355 RepID=A0A4Q9L6T8_9MICR|nr:hypothetical protein CWI37_0327p0010 [Hamiltosporidium tvaerminnensis]
MNNKRFKKLQHNTFNQIRKEKSVKFSIKRLLLTSIRRNIMFISFIILFLEIHQCFRITIDFTDRALSEGVPAKQITSCLYSTQHCRKRKYKTDRVVHQQNKSLISSSKDCSYEYIGQKEYNKAEKILRLDEKYELISNVDYKSTELSCNKDSYKKDPRCLPTSNINREAKVIKYSEDEKVIFDPNISNSITFDYSSDFIIRSKFFDDLGKTGLEEIDLNINNITKSNVDIVTCEMLINILICGEDFGFPDLIDENFLALICLIFDLSCYSKSGELERLYKNLLPSFFVYLGNKPRSKVFQIEIVEEVEQKNVFLPFLSVVYDSVDISFDENTKELEFVKKKHYKKSKLLEINITDKLIIRITPFALIHMQENDTKEKEIFLRYLFSYYKINGIRISADNKYYSEYKNSKYNCDFSIEESIISYQKINICYLRRLFETKRKNEIKYVELERIILSIDDIIYLKSLKNIETLILVNCNSEIRDSFVQYIPLNFQNLINLTIIGYTFKDRFWEYFNILNLEILDLSWCKHLEKVKQIFHKEMNNLKEFRMNNASLNHRIINYILRSPSLEILSLKGLNFSRLRYYERFIVMKQKYRVLDLSGCRFNKLFLEFFSTNIIAEILFLEHLNDSNNLIQILSQNTLHLSTKFLSISENFMSLNLLEIIHKFKSLECLRLIGMKMDSLRASYSDIILESNLFELDISRNKLENIFFTFLYQFYSLNKLDLSNCNINAGFVKYLCVPNISASLKNLDLSGNNLGASDIYNLRFLRNLNHLIVSFDNDVFSEFTKKYGDFMCLNLVKLVLFSTKVNNEIINCIMAALPSIKYVELSECNFDDVVFKILIGYEIDVLIH